MWKEQVAIPTVKHAKLTMIWTDRQTDRQTDKQIDRETDRQTNKQTADSNIPEHGLPVGIRNRMRPKPLSGLLKTLLSHALLFMVPI